MAPVFSQRFEPLESSMHKPCQRPVYAGAKEVIKFQDGMYKKILKFYACLHFLFHYNFI